MQFPLSLIDISLWLAITALVLLITAEMLSQRYHQGTIRIDKKRLRNVTVLVSISFLVTVVVRILGMIIRP